MSESGWSTYRHRHDDSIVYEARRVGDLYEVRTTETGEPWTVAAEDFEGLYEAEETEEEE